jgi:hypothetical protein
LHALGSDYSPDRTYGIGNLIKRHDDDRWVTIGVFVWNNGSWAQLGARIFGEFYRFAEFNGDLVLLGCVSAAFSAPLAGVLGWSEETWQPLTADYVGASYAIDFRDHLVLLQNSNLVEQYDWGTPLIELRNDAGHWLGRGTNGPVIALHE